MFHILYTYSPDIILHNIFKQFCHEKLVYIELPHFGVLPETKNFQILEHSGFQIL